MSNSLRDYPDQYGTIVGSVNAQKFLHKGVTTVRDLGGYNYGDLAIRYAIESGLIPGPRLLCSGKLLTMTGGHGHFFGVEVDGADEARKAARVNLKKGVDNIKLVASGGVITPNVYPWSASLTVEEMEAAILEAKKAGKITAAHAQATEGIQNAIKAGVRTIEHGFWLDEYTCEMMIKNNVYFSPTLLAAHQILRYAEEKNIPAFIVDKIKAINEDHCKSFQLALKMGVKVICGSDSGTPFNFPGDTSIELELMHGLGASFDTCLLSATSMAAECLQLDSQVGVVKEGLFADLLVVSGDPRKDLKVLRNPQMVFKEGKLINRENTEIKGELQKVKAQEVLAAAKKFAESGCGCL